MLWVSLKVSGCALSQSLCLQGHREQSGAFLQEDLGVFIPETPRTLLPELCFFPPLNVPCSRRGTLNFALLLAVEKVNFQEIM